MLNDTEMTTRPVMKGRWYFGEYIHPRNVYGMWSCRVDGRQYAADTLAGMKSLIRQALDA